MQKWVWGLVFVIPAKAGIQKAHPGINSRATILQSPEGDAQRQRIKSVQSVESVNEPKAIRPLTDRRF